MQSEAVSMKVQRNLKPKEHIKLSNQSLVFEAFGESEKLTISELTFRINEGREKHQIISEQTVRRAVNDLVSLGHLKPYGKSNNAMVYGKLSAAMTDGAKQEVVPFADDLLTVSEFIKVMASPESRPFTLKVPIMSEQVSHSVRRIMLHVILSAGEAGNNEALKISNRRLNNVIAELEFITRNLRNFVDSAVWYPTYRDGIAYGVRKLVEEDPETFQLANEYMRSE